MSISFSDNLEVTTEDEHVIQKPTWPLMRNQIVLLQLELESNHQNLNAVYQMTKGHVVMLNIHSCHCNLWNAELRFVHSCIYDA